MRIILVLMHSVLWSEASCMRVHGSEACVCVHMFVCVCVHCVCICVCVHLCMSLWWEKWLVLAVRSITYW